MEDETMEGHGRDKRESGMPLQKWTPPPKRLALDQSSSGGEPTLIPPLLDESSTIITTPKILLRHHQPELVQYISIESLVPYLNQQQLLTDDENHILLNLILSNRTRALKLVQFIQSKGEEGFRRFLTAVAEEPEHLGHKEITKLFATYRCAIPSKHTEALPLKRIANSVALQAALQPIQGAEFDLEEAAIGGQVIEITGDPDAEIAGKPGSETNADLQSSKRSTSSGCESESAAKSGSSQPSSSQSSSQCPSGSAGLEDDVEEITCFLENDEPEEPCTRIVRKYPTLIFPSGPLRRKSNSLIYTSLFKMAWSGNEDRARLLMTHLRRSKEVSVDIKIVSMEVVHTVNAERDLKVLTSALAFTDRPTCENKSILKCRLHRRIAGLHYRNNDLEEANEHMDTALQLAHNIGPDIDTIYTNRLKALMLFEEYKKTRSRDSYRDANRFFTRAMDHARIQPESKRIITERVKISKALFHLDMWEEYRKEEKEQETLTELEYRAQDTLEDVDEEYLTDGDRAFLYMTQAKLHVCGKDWKAAESEVLKAHELNQRCGLEKRAKEAEELLAQIRASSKDAHSQ